MVISDVKPNSSYATELNMKYKKYYIKNESALKLTSLSGEQFQSVQNLIKKEPSEIPQDPFLFEIWQNEYIEKGLRES